MERKNLRGGFESLGPGSHICSIYSKREEKLSTISTFMEIGQERNEKCLYIYDEDSKEDIVKEFRRSGFEIDSLIDSGQFEFLTDRESYLKDGCFEPEGMFKLLSKAEDEALEQGFSGLRASGEMEWFFNQAPGAERLMDYESKLNEFVRSKEIVLLCQYDERRFSPEELIDVIHTHPRIVIHEYLYENYYYMPPEVFAKVVKGEVDEDYYREIKSNLIEEASLPAVKMETEEEGDESINDLLETVEKLEQTTR